MNRGRGFHSRGLLGRSPVSLAELPAGIRSYPGDDDERQRSMEEWLALPPKVRVATPNPLTEIDLGMNAKGLNPAASDPMGNWGGDGKAPKERRKGFWEGGDKFRGRDAIAGLLAAVGDAFAAQNDQEGYGVKSLLGGRLDAREYAREREKELAEAAVTSQDRERKINDVVEASGGRINRTKAATIVDDSVSASFYDPPELKPMAGPDGMYVWDPQNRAFIHGGNQGNGGSGDRDATQEEIEEARRSGRLIGGPTGYRSGGFRR